MLGRMVEIAEDHRHLSVVRGFLVVEDTSQEHGSSARELGRVPLDDMAALIVHANDITYTHNVLTALAQRGAPVVLCTPNHLPIAMLWPVDGHHLQAKRFDAQIAAGKPVQKRVWAAIVKAKLQQQAATLEAAGVVAAPVAALARQVRSGDPDNKEAQAARAYWGLLFGPGFHRNQSAGGINALLNYGYTVHRAAVARAIIAAGLHPTLGVHHSNEGNAMRLADDLMEPFRPLVDFKVWQLLHPCAAALNTPQGAPELTPEVKRALVQTLSADMLTAAGATPASVCMQRLATSLAQVYLGERTELDLPYPELPLDLAGI